MAYYQKLYFLFSFSLLQTYYQMNQLSIDQTITLVLVFLYQLHQKTMILDKKRINYSPNFATKGINFISCFLFQHCYSRVLVNLSNTISCSFQEISSKFLTLISYFISCRLKLIFNSTFFHFFQQALSKCESIISKLVEFVYQNQVVFTIFQALI